MNIDSRSFDMSAIQDQEMVGVEPSTVNLRPISMPTFNITKDRWAQLRTLNVENLAEQWKQYPSMVKVLEDSKLQGEPLVVFRKQFFEFLVRLARDLEQGQAGTGYDVEIVNTQLRLLKNVLEERQLLDKENPILKDAVEALSLSWAKVRSKLFVFSRGKRLEPSPLTDEERAQLQMED